MTGRIRHALAALAACVAVATSLTLGTASPALAFGGETFGCRIAPGTVLTWSPTCTNSMTATTYNVGFAVLNGSGAYTYSWSISGPYQFVITGCTSTSYDCAVSVRGFGERTITATVTYSQAGQSATATSTAYIFP